MAHELKLDDEKTQLEYRQTGDNSARVVATIEGIVHEIDLYVCTPWQSKRIDEIRKEVINELRKI